jgi:hypothetical protein
LYGVRASSLLALLLTAGPICAANPDKARDHWSVQPVRRPAVPAVRDRSWARSPVDAFVLARLEVAGLRPAPAADKRTLLRRVYLDLIGLPPTRAEQRAFLADTSAGAFARVVDALLARPEYGERWGRHWLDVARYAETNGYERDGAKPSAWRYRDYVIDALNADLPYDRFVREQLAGDELPASDARTQIATTFLRLGTWDDEPANEKMDRYDQLDDVLGVTASAFLGLTLRCARCHDHKFEPFSQADYYRMLAVFEPLKRPQKGRADLDRPVGTAAQRAAFELAVARLQRPPDLPRAYVWFEDGPTAPPTHVLRRGNPSNPGAEVKPGVPAVLARQQPAPPTPLAHSTGRRLWLARWVASPNNPLTARVMVNRVWAWHFGKGLVATPSDFGVAGERPSHPELLDWLASEFVAGGWRLKRLHRLIVLSSVYQTSAVLERGERRADERLALFGRWRQHRAEAEVVRDSVLAVSGRLNPQGHGPSVYPTLPRAVLESQSLPGNGWGKSDERQSSRRSVYVFSKRSLALPELELLDAPGSANSCEQRPLSTTAPQALTFLNGAFMQEQAGHFADRLRREAGVDSAAQVGLAFELALCRPPRPDEVRLALDFLARQEALLKSEAHALSAKVVQRRALAAFCLVLLNANEFVYPG